MRDLLYLTRTGLLEPLGQSQVFSYLRGLSSHFSITLITYERADDLADKLRLNALKAECSALGINWKPQRFRLRPKFIAPIFNMLGMLYFSLREVQRSDIKFIHARSYIPAAVAMVVSKLAKVPFIFDMRALWPEEMITAGRLKRGSLIHKMIVLIEKACLRDAAIVVSLTHAAVDYLASQYPNHFSRGRVVVIPTCADLDRFVPFLEPSASNTLGCLGSVLSGWFRLDWLKSFMQVAFENEPQLVFEITTRDDPSQVRKELDPDDILGSRLRIASSPSSSVHKVLQKQLASVMFYAGGEVSELGRSPTRMAEVLGCGLPVVANAGVGDVARIIQEFNVGVVARSQSPEDMLSAWKELEFLFQDPGLSRRCRYAAETVFSLKQGTSSYLQVYEQVLGTKRRAV